MRHEGVEDEERERVERGRGPGDNKSREERWKEMGQGWRSRTCRKESRSVSESKRRSFAVLLCIQAVSLLERTTDPSWMEHICKRQRTINMSLNGLFPLA
jgi:hypothetical protein